MSAGGVSRAFRDCRPDVGMVGWSPLGVGRRGNGGVVCDFRGILPAAMASGGAVAASLRFPMG